MRLLQDPHRALGIHSIYIPIYLLQFSQIGMNEKYRIKIGEVLSDTFDANQGVRQGCILSPFTIVGRIFDVLRCCCYHRQNFCWIWVYCFEIIEKQDIKSSFKHLIGREFEFLWSYYYFITWILAHLLFEIYIFPKTVNHFIHGFEHT